MAYSQKAGKLDDAMSDRWKNVEVSDGVIAYDIRQQDGSTVTMRMSDNIHNRQLADYIYRHEPYADTMAGKRFQWHT